MDDIAIILQDSLRTELGILPKDYSVSASSGIDNQVLTGRCLRLTCTAILGRVHSP